MTENALELVKLTGFLTGDQIAELYIRSEKADSAKRKLNGWLNGYRFLGGREVPLNVPLRHFIDGKTILVHVDWLRDFWTLNAEHFHDDSTGEGAAPG